jgi:hypothetical protein
MFSRNFIQCLTIEVGIWGHGLRFIVFMRRLLSRGLERYVTSVVCYCSQKSMSATNIRVEIVPKHSAILPAYNSTSIHGDHTSMTRFTGKDDSGYVKVSDTLWLWISEIEKTNEERSRNESLGTSNAGYGFVNSGGGPVFIGSGNAGRDITSFQFGR